MSVTSPLLVVLLVAGASLAVFDVTKTQQRTIVIYTTPALRDLLESDIIPDFQRATSHRVAPVYVGAGQQYNRLRMSGSAPEADLFVHASPLYLEKGYEEGRIAPIRLDAALNESFASRDVGEGARIWHAFAWSPLVAVHRSGAPAEDLGTTDARFGFPHPILSNNGIYVAILLEGTDPSVADHLLAQTRVQPTNARANIGGVADGSFELTLGYEAVARFYQAQGARISYEIPTVHGAPVTTRVVFSAGLIAGDRHPGAEAFLRYLLSPPGQAALAEHAFRPVIDGSPEPAGALDLADATVIEQDWSQWAALEAKLPNYEVKV